VTIVCDCSSYDVLVMFGPCVSAWAVNQVAVMFAWVAVDAEVMDCSLPVVKADAPLMSVGEGASLANLPWISGIGGKKGVMDFVVPAQGSHSASCIRHCGLPLTMQQRAGNVLVFSKRIWLWGRVPCGEHSKGLMFLTSVSAWPLAKEVAREPTVRPMIARMTARMLLIKPCLM